MRVDLETQRLTSRAVHGGAPLRPAPGGPAAGQAAGVGQGDQSFAAVLRQQVAGGVRFSGHAQQRLEARAIHLDSGQMGRLAGALGSLADKGGRTSLVLLDGFAMVVSVPNRTVITAVDAGEQAVFTNIDSAIRA
jgi:flagellar operon protein